MVDHGNSNGFIPTDLVHIYGQLALLGSRALDTDGNLPLQTISGTTLPPAFGTLTLTGVSAAPSGGLSLGSIAASASTSAVAASLAGVVALLWPSSLGDSSLYTDEQLKTLEHGRTRVRLHVEVKPDGTLKGYGYNTQSRRDWEMVPVVQFQPRGDQQVADSAMASR